MSKKEWAILAVLLVIAFTAHSWVMHRYLAEPNPGANDFYSRWAGAAALLRDGRDPYALEVTQEIQKVIDIDPAQVGRGGFHYPLHVAFLFLPLVYVPYTWAQAIWQTVLLWVIIAIVLVLIRHQQWKLSPFGMAALILAGILFYPATRSVLLGQFTLHVTLFVALSLYCLQNGRDGWAGIFLAATSIKPQMVAPLGILLLLWTLKQKRWRFVQGVLAGGAAMFVAALFLYPRWPISFVEDMFRYSDVAGGRNPVLVLLQTVGLPEWLRWGVTAVLLLITLYSWYRAWHSDDWHIFRLAVFWTIAANAFVPFQTGTTNQVILIIPLFIWLHEGVQRWGGWLMTAFTIPYLFLLWYLFLTFRSGDYENQILFLPVPLLALAVLFSIELTQRRRGAEAQA